MLGEHLNKFIIVYLNNIIVYLNSKEEHGECKGLVKRTESISSQ